MDLPNYEEMSTDELKEEAYYNDDQDALDELNERDSCTNEELGLDEDGNREDE